MIRMIRNITTSIAPLIYNYTYGNSTQNFTGGMMSHRNVCESSSITFKEILFATFLLFVLFANLLGNSLVVFACTHSSQLKKRKNTYFIVSLAFCDIIYAITIIPIYVSQKLHNDNFCHSSGACYFIHVMDPIVNVASIITIFIIAIDRFIAITMPFRYTHLMTATTAKSLIVGSWLFALFWSFIGLFQWGAYNAFPKNTWSVMLLQSNLRMCIKTNNSYYFAASFIGIYIIPLIIITFTYGMVLYVAFTQIQAIETTTVSNDNFSPTHEESIKKGNSQTNRKRRKEWKATKSVATVYICYFLCWFPLFVLNMIILYNPRAFSKLTVSQRLAVSYTFIDILPTLNTMVNPIIYSFANNHFREGFKAALTRCIGRKLIRQKSDNTFTRSITRIMSITSINGEINLGAHGGNSGNHHNTLRPDRDNTRDIPLSQYGNNEVSGNHLTPYSAHNTPRDKPRSGTVGLENHCYDQHT